MKTAQIGLVSSGLTSAQRGESTEEVSGRNLGERQAAEGFDDTTTTLRPNPESTIPLTLGRRELLRAGLGGAASVLAGVAVESQTALASQEVENNAKPKHRIIDTHCHPCYIGYDGARIIENMNAAGIERAWLLSWEIPEREMDPSYHSEIDPSGAGVGITFRDVIDVAERYPDRFILGTTMDPHDPYALQKLKAAVDIFRVRVFGEFKRRMRYDDPDAIRLFHYCGELGLPVTFHLDTTFPRHGVPSAWQWWYGGGIEVIEAPLRLCPHTHFQGHSPAFWREISADADQANEAYPTGKIVGRGRLLEYLDKYPNLNCDLSAGSGLNALRRDLDFARKFLVDYQDRLFFGRDDFDNNLYDLLVSLNLPPAVLAKILGGNALRLVPA